jgi:hypothetical protein
MARSQEKPKVGFDSAGNLLVTLDRIYSFREPLGRDLEVIERALGEQPSNTRIAAVILGTLSLDKMDAEAFLDLPARVFKELGGLVVEHFRLLDNGSV